MDDMPDQMRLKKEIRISHKNGNEISDEKLWLDELKKGEKEAFRKLYDDYHQKVYSTAITMLGNAEDAEDAVQEVFMKIYRKVSSFDGRSKIGTWLYRIAVNVCIDHVRRNKIQRFKTVSVEEETLVNLHERGNEVEKSITLGEVNKITRNAITRLSPKLRTVVVLRDLQGLAHAEIADILGCSKGTVSSRLNRGRLKLRSLLKFQGLDKTYLSEI